MLTIDNQRQQTLTIDNQQQSSTTINNQRKLATTNPIPQIALSVQNHSFGQT